MSDLPKPDLTREEAILLLACGPYAGFGRTREEFSRHARSFLFPFRAVSRHLSELERKGFLERDRWGRFEPRWNSEAWKGWEAHCAREKSWVWIAFQPADGKRTGGA